MPKLSDSRGRNKGGAWQAMGLVAAIIIVLFGGYELIERTWLSSAELRKIHLLHIIRGIVSTLLGGSAVAWYLTRSGTMPVLERMEPLRETEIADRKTSWLIRMRWLAVVGVTTAVASSRNTTFTDPSG